MYTTRWIPSNNSSHFRQQSRQRKTSSATVGYVCEIRLFRVTLTYRSYVNPTARRHLLGGTIKEWDSSAVKCTWTRFFLITPCSFNKDSVKITALSRCITQPKVEPGVGASQVNIERVPASAGNAVVSDRKKQRESAVTLMHFYPQMLNLSGKRKQQMPATVVWGGL